MNIGVITAIVTVILPATVVSQIIMPPVGMVTIIMGTVSAPVMRILFGVTVRMMACVGQTIVAPGGDPGEKHPRLVFLIVIFLEVLVEHGMISRSILMGFSTLPQAHVQLNPKLEI